MSRYHRGKHFGNRPPTIADAAFGRNKKRDVDEVESTHVGDPSGEGEAEPGSRTGPLLLVSVRSGAEAHSAICGGAVILDIKDPERGALGRASPTVWREVIGVAAGADRPVTAALGELLEMEPAALEWAGPPPRLLGLKLGLAGCAGRTDWQGRLDVLGKSVATWKAGGPAAARSPWLIAAAYADAALACAPEPEAILEYALDRKLGYFLLDTFSKRHGRLLDWWDAGRLGALIEKAHRGGVRVALAGSLRSEDLEHVLHLGPDVIAVRGAACESGDRGAQVDARRVRGLADRLGSEERLPAC